MAEKVNLTVGRINELVCPAGKSQAFLRDLKSPWLAVRITANGAKSFVFEAKLNRVTIRVVIGSTNAWSIETARQAANEKKILVDRGIDPRSVKKDAVAAIAKESAETQRQAVLVNDAWAQYLQEGHPRGKPAWKPRYLLDLQKATSPGGEEKKRGQGTTKPGPLFALMGKRLIDCDQDAIRDWYAIEAKRGGVQAARALAMFGGFLAWCATRREWRELINRDAAKASDLRDLLPAKTTRTDALEIGQLSAWFKALESLPNRTAAAYLVALLLTGARREEMAGVKRTTDVDLRWNSLTLADKVGVTRTIPLTPYLRALFDSLPVISGNPYMFASPGSKSGRIADPRSAHAMILSASGIGHVTIHGLRRSFALLGEAAGAPAGAIAQIMGHRPSAISEKYKPRPLDTLREYLNQIEVFILEKGGVVFTPQAPSIVR